MNPPALPDQAQCALFLDFDGVLVEIAPRPQAVQVAPALPGLLRLLATRLGGRLAVVSGRPVAEIDDFLARAAPHAVGLHGAESRGPEGKVSRLRPPPGIAAARAVLATAANTHPALYLEDKGLALALHWRGAPELEDTARQAAEQALAAAGGSLQLQPGKMVAELKPEGVSKGAALAALMRAPPFAGARPLMLGDDLTDESAFEAARDLGGQGVLVGPPRKTAATAHLPDVGAVHRWLAALAEG
ncbi:MAG: trehalose-phosphatase [Pararhodobacter sp.]|nr:trehalose-phosphatase [Pararhodobacter sp.]